MQALLVIDVTLEYLTEEFFAVQIEPQTYDDFIDGITQRVVNINNERVFFFYDRVGKNLPEPLEDLALQHTKREKHDMSAFDVSGMQIHKSTLHLELRTNNIKIIEVCGLYSNYCVYSTVSDALWLGYDVLVNPRLILGANGQIGADIDSIVNLGVRPSNKGTLRILA